MPDACSETVAQTHATAGGCAQPGGPEPAPGQPAVVAPGMTWCILRSATNMEPRVAKALAGRSLAGVGRVLVPTVAERRARAGQSAIVEKKLYPGYVFVEVALEEGQVPDDLWHLVKATTGALGFLGDRRPVPVSEAEAAAVLDIATRKERVVRGPDYRAGDAVRVVSGSFEGHSGTVEKVDERRGVATVNIAIFGRLTPIDVGCWEVEKEA